jgi:hypothetical protein
MPCSSDAHALRRFYEGDPMILLADDDKISLSTMRASSTVADMLQTKKRAVASV